ncbi:MAG TPA: hypothetical protein VGO09_11280 [Flavisolibacter sp.]|jgi:hypothetical protein|nr:hypothetical protein [Flavisolibacter sp.]
MKHFLHTFFLFIPLFSLGQIDTSGLAILGKETVLSEVVIRSDLKLSQFLMRVKNDTSFYKAFRNLRILGFTSLNDIKILDKSGAVHASLYSKTKQTINAGCRTMQILEEKSTGDIYNGQELNYYTAGLYAGLFFTKGKVCGETNIVKNMEWDVNNKSGIEKHKEQLKMLFFNPGKKIPGIPFIGDKIDVFDPEIAKYYQFSIDMEDIKEQSCYIFKILPLPNLSESERKHLVFDNITTWFNAKTMEIVGRKYDLSYNTPVYDFDVHMEVWMTHFKGLLVPELLRYKGNWKVVFKKRERAVFTATLFDFD